MDQNPSCSKADRKTIEKNRRNQMKSLYSQLSSLLPHQNSREVVSLPDQLGEATNYIKSLQIDLEKMNQKKDRLTGLGNCSSSTMGELKLPHVEIHVSGSAVEVALITGLDCQFMFSEIIRMFHEEGAEVINASFSIQDDTIFHTIHSKVFLKLLMNSLLKIRFE
ncbi:transcription factor bHLH36 [Olea europaea subsp. europaea]|uniref:Transcription factor bHLH36 n=1 Tax=Olea europaea subsp. europaea TaxID=158383 RepID=A0A8S0V464_OLEEU|nr:transcription factor bHLH36 [Olea europaea subsp. europaea]